MDTTVITDWGDAVLVAATDALRNFLGFLPQLIGAILVLVIGWIVAGLVAGLIERILTRIGFERAAESTGIAGFVRQSGSEWTVSKVVAEIVKWFIRLIAIQAAAQILGMERISEIINAILLWLPNLVVALAILVIGALIARFVAGLVRGATSEMGFANPGLMGSIARYAILVFAVIAAVDQLGIAENVVLTLFSGAVIAVAGAVAIAFGFGGQQTAARITESWYQRGQEASQRVAQYAQRKQAEGPAKTAGASPTPGARRTTTPRPATGETGGGSGGTGGVPAPRD